MSEGSSWLRPLREFAAAVTAVTGWGWLGHDGDGAPPPQPCGPGALVIQSLVMIGVAAAWCLGKIAFYGGVAAAGWLVVFVPLALPVALAAALRPPRMVLGLTTAGVAAAVAGLLTVVVLSDHLAGFWLAFAGLSVAALVAAAVFGYLTTSPGRTST